MSLRCVTPTGRPRRGTWALLLGIPLLLLATWPFLRFDLADLGTSALNLQRFLTRFAVTPEWSYLPKLGGLLLETFLIAFVASILGILISLPLSFLAARNTTPSLWLAGPLRGLASVMRAIPDLLLALLLASALGLGQVPGVLALAFAAVGFLIKTFAESLETVDRKPIEGVLAHGAGWLGVRTVGVFPQAAPDLAGLSLYILDSSIRSATILGFVGAGGIGYDLTQAMRLFRFERLGLLLLSIYLMVTLIDRLSDRLRGALR